MTEYKMWAVVNCYGVLCGFGYTKNDAKHTALAGVPGAKWKDARADGWRVVPVTVIVPDEEEK